MTMHVVNQNEGRTLTPAERADEDARMAKACATGAVRWEPCSLCAARAYSPCQLSPAGDHLARWLSAYSSRRITRDDMFAVIADLIIVTADELVPERRP